MIETASRPSDDPTLHGKIADDLRQAISSGRFPVGGRLPTEAALCKTYGASRYTVREALRDLIELGLIERRQGVGSRVIADRPRATYINSMRTLAEFAQYAQDTRLEIAAVEMTRIGEEAAALIPAPRRSAWIQITGVRFDQERIEAICHTTVYAHARFAPFLDDIGGDQAPIYALIEERSGEVIAEATQEITARPAPARIASDLGVKTGAPMMRFVRRYLDASGGTMLASLNWHPADRYAYVTTIRRGDWAP